MARPLTRQLGVTPDRHVTRRGLGNAKTKSLRAKDQMQLPPKAASVENGKRKYPTVAPSLTLLLSLASTPTSSK